MIRSRFYTAVFLTRCVCVCVDWGGGESRSPRSCVTNSDLENSEALTAKEVFPTLQARPAQITTAIPVYGPADQPSTELE